MSLHDWMNRINDLLYHDLCVWARTRGCRINEATEIVNNAITTFRKEAMTRKIKCLYSLNMTDDAVWMQVKRYMLHLVTRLIRELLSDNTLVATPDLFNQDSPLPSTRGGDLYARLDKAHALLPTNCQVVGHFRCGYSTADITIKLAVRIRKCRMRQTTTTKRRGGQSHRDN